MLWQTSTLDSHSLSEYVPPERPVATSYMKHGWNTPAFLWQTSEALDGSIRRHPQSSVFAKKVSQPIDSNVTTEAKPFILGQRKTPAVTTSPVNSWMNVLLFLPLLQHWQIAFKKRRGFCLRVLFHFFCLCVIPPPQQLSLVPSLVSLATSIWMPFVRVILLPLVAHAPENWWKGFQVKPTTQKVHRGTCAPLNKHLR